MCIGVCVCVRTHSINIHCRSLSLPLGSCISVSQLMTIIGDWLMRLFYDVKQPLWGCDLAPSLSRMAYNKEAPCLLIFIIILIHIQ